MGESRALCLLTDNDLILAEKRFHFPGSTTTRHPDADGEQGGHNFILSNKPYKGTQGNIICSNGYPVGVRSIDRRAVGRSMINNTSRIINFV